MASPESALFALLTTGASNPVAALIGKRAYPDKLPQGVLYPAIRLQRISTSRSPYRILATGRSVFARPRFQIDCWAATRAEALTLAEAVRDLLDGYRGISNEFAVESIAIEDEGGDVEAGIGPGNTDIYRERIDLFLSHASE